MSRPSDQEYFIDQRTEHVAQGDIFRDLPFAYFVPDETAYRQEGKRRPLDEPPEFNGHGMLINYTSLFMAQPPETRGYSHPFRVVAPIFPFTMLADLKVPDQVLKQLRAGDVYNYYMYLPAYPGEWDEAAVMLHRPVLLHHDLLEGHRVTQLQMPSAQQLQRKLAGVFLGKIWDLDLFEPDLSDHWNP